MAIPPPLLRPFEETIVRRWKGEEVPERWRFGTTAVSPKAAWIKGFLKTVPSAYVKQMFEEWRNFTEKAKLIPGTPKFRVGSYGSFCTYIWILSSLDLITLVRRAPRKNPRQVKKHYYSLNPSMEKAPEWLHPMQAKYPSTDWANEQVFPEERKKAIRRRVKEEKRKRKKAALRLAG